MKAEKREGFKEQAKEQEGVKEETKNTQQEATEAAPEAAESLGQAAKQMQKAEEQLNQAENAPTPNRPPLMPWKKPSNKLQRKLRNLKPLRNKRKPWSS